MQKEEIMKYVTLQMELVQAFQDKLGQVSTSSLIDIPKKGEIILEKKVWSFRKHGVGIEFTEEKTRIKVDVEDIRINPSYFDEWRLRTYLGSLRNKGTKLLSSLTGTKDTTLDKKIDAWFSNLLKRGIIEQINNYYRIKE